jgi:hypothetical protein
MSYLAQSALATFDQYFKNRLAMSVAEQAKVFTNDSRPEYKLLADQAIGSYLSVTDQLLPLVATQPGMTSDATDGEIMAAVQFLWPLVGARLVPPPPMPRRRRGYASVA